MKNISLLALLVCSGVTLFSQNYQPATIVKTDGSRAEGEINYQNWKNNPTRIKFRSGKSSSPVTYTVADLQSFAVGGDRYATAIVEVDERNDDLGNLTYDGKIITKTDTVFLRTLIEGKKSLFLFEDGVEHFYIGREDKYELLRFKKFFVEAFDPNVINGNGRGYAKHIRVNRDFAVTLGEYLEQCQAVKTSLAKAKYDEKSLRNLFNESYKCNSQTPEFVQSAENSKFEIGALAGVSRTSFDVTASTNSPIARIEYPNSTNFAAGIFVNIVFPRQRGRMSLMNELMYSSYQTKGTFRNATSPTRYEEETFTFEYAYIKLNTMFRYGFLFGNNSIFINGGISNGLALNEVNTSTMFRKIESYEISSTNVGHNSTRKHELGFLGGIGFKRNRASIELRTERGGGPFRDTNSKAHVNRYYALFGYRIK